MFRPKNNHERVIHRLKIARGHLNKVIEMVENGEYCIDVLHQSLAVQKALEETDGLVLKNHLQTCAASAIREGKQEKAIEEIMGVFKRRN